ncbi:biotin--[acetyl-CoA-carboxylase] ligase [Plebeiibacterium marinum]|uniref:Biotin--[acetyl-CoA-carboxylase] ligase n=1 Tax=Plebeiibacterium marinum TaxID=2992111 RepID=A0AAE3SJ28_9BACT|nr:biotin--[acetyl-CoA-carboxylase] ligase [Plebeiobacterium marinum]MCW3805282.1 biotin--[acetyl-CoA-carboxylase] ligase [Plebeiobacterium marinum]
MTQLAGFKIMKFEELSSTNEKVKELIKDDIQDCTVVIAKHQYAGKGQKGNSWESEKGKNLTFSLFIKPEYIQAQDQFVISKVVCLGILKVLQKYSDGFSIKWPNDIYYNNSKIGGILIENSILLNAIGTSTIGIGLNINQEKFLSDAPNPISLKNICKKEFCLQSTLHDILEQISVLLGRVRVQNEHLQINKEYMNALFRKEGYHLYKDEEGIFKARILDISEYGQLVLLKESGDQTTYSFKEVEFIL